MSIREMEKSRRFYENHVATTEKIAVRLVELLRNNELIKGEDSYLELYVDEIYRSL